MPSPVAPRELWDRRDPGAADQRREVYLDARGGGRALRLRWHPEAAVVVLSLWRDDMCVGTFRLPRADVGPFVDALVACLHAPPRRQTAAVAAPVRGGGRHRPEARVGSTGPADSMVTDWPLADQPAPSVERASFLDWAFSDDETGEQRSAG